MTPLPAAFRARVHEHRGQRTEYTIAAAAIVLLFAVLQTIYILQQFNSPSDTEAHSAIAGLRTFDGHGWNDGYLRVLPGSLLWPVLSGGAFDLWGMSGPRMVALVLVVTGFAALLSATRWLFGAKATVFTALALALSAPFWVAGHLGSMEALALAAACIAVWAIVQLARYDHRGWLLLATAMVSVAMLTHYRSVLLLIPASLLLAALRHRRAPIDIGLMWLLAGLALVIYFDVFSTQIVDVLSPEKVFGLSVGMGSFDSANVARAIVILWGGVPLAIGGFAWYRNVPLRPVIAAFVAGPAIWVTLWIFSARAGATLVHLDLAFGTILLYPVVGLALSQVDWDRARLLVLGAVTLGLLLLSAQQTNAFDQGWPDTSETVATLVGSMQPGDQVLSNERWPYVLELYAADRIEAPDDVLDETLLFERDVVFDVCSFSWFVDSQSFDPWSALVMTGVQACGTFEQVIAVSSQVSSLTDDLRARSDTVQTIVRHNTSPFREDT